MIKHDNDNRKGLRYLSVCSGIEAASEAWRPLGWEAVAFSEIEKFPSAVLAHRHPHVPNLGDMTKFEEWPNFGKDSKAPNGGAIDLLVGGTPCQSYSVAGLRKGLDDARGNLMLTYGAIARRYRPRWLVWENVPGVLSSDGGRDFASLLGLLSGRRVECPSTGWRNAGIVEGYKGAYGLAWRVLDAQYVRVDGFTRAVPQRRRRVFVVGYLGDWRRAAAVLFEREGLCGHSAPRREAGQDFTRDVAQCLVSSGRGVERTGDTRGQDNVVAHASGGGNTSGPIEAAACLTAKGQRIDFEVETFVAQGFAPSLTGNPYGDHESREGLLVAHTLKGEGYDGSEDGTGRGTPIVPITVDVADTLSVGANQTTGFQSEVVAFDYKASGRNGFGVGEIAPTLRAMSSAKSNQNAGGQIAFATQWAVRRLTPTECARLQGFPDDHCRIPWRGKPAELCPDGPQYKALGNSMAVNAMRWIGQRIQAVEEIAEETPIAIAA